MRLDEVALDIDLAEPIDAVSTGPLPESLAVLGASERYNEFTERKEWNVLMLTEETSQ